MKSDNGVTIVIVLSTWQRRFRGRYVILSANAHSAARKRFWRCLRAIVACVQCTYVYTRFKKSN